jgi:hypothetical protein
MKVIIAGSRDITEYDIVLNAVKLSQFHITEVVCGKAKGVDTLGEEFGLKNDIPVKFFPADWNGLGRAAGPIRNKQMGDYADALIAIWNGSKGTKHMIDYAISKDLKVYVHKI